jgi:glycosyltransferase involved in cell wall biosynthesis
MRPVRILFVSYWSLGESLTDSMVRPYLRILAERPDVASIRFVSIESSPSPAPQVPLRMDKVSHTAVHPSARLPHLLAKAELNLRTARLLERAIRQERCDLIIAASSMAGAAAHTASRRTQVPYAVYCFEPHADYMAECGVWPHNGLKYRFARRMEQLQMRNALRIMTVTENYRQHLVAQGLDADRFRTMPCVIDTASFIRPAEDRVRLRAELGIPTDATVGVYVGKFGGLYYDDEAFRVFKAAHDRFPRFHLLILSGMDADTILGKAARAGIPPSCTHVRSVPHAQVPAHLSAADLAFSTVRPGPSKRFQCPVKNGEYWAAGLPILMSDGIGDDHLLLRQGIGGAVFNDRLDDLDHAFAMIQELMGRPAEMRAIAEKTRALSIARDTLGDLIDLHLRKSGPPA